MVKRRDLDTLLKMQENKEKIVSLLKQGFSVEAIAMSLDVSQPSVRYWLRLEEVKEKRDEILKEKLDKEMILISQVLKKIKTNISGD